MDSFWKISDFANKVGKHLNTVDGWFKKLEEQGIHYINRTESTGEKVYDDLDLRIAQYIVEKRNSKWALEAIFNEIGSHFDLRTSPVNTNVPEHIDEQVDINALKVDLIKEISTVLESTYKNQFEQYKKELDSKFNSLPTLLNVREQRLNEIIVRRRIESKLEKEAIQIWMERPDSEKYKKRGWFRREEDTEKKNKFVKEYIDEHFEKRLKVEFELE